MASSKYPLIGVRLSVFLWAALFYGPIFAQGISVGPTPDCDVVITGTDPAALNTALAETEDIDFGLAVRELTGPILLPDRPVTLTGGFRSCGEVAAVLEGVFPSTDRTVVRGTADGPAIRYQASLANVPRNSQPHDQLARPHIAAITNLIVEGGPAGGVVVEGPTKFNINNTIIRGNRAEIGAGLRVRGALTTVRLDHVVIDDNHASLDGGGIACSGGANVVVGPSSFVIGNTAGELGGGIDALNCRLEVRGSVENNQAESDGGGIHATTGSVIDLIGVSAPVRIAGNVADSNLDGDGSGGGIYAGDRNTIVRAESVHLLNNRAGLHGGGVMLEGAARVRFQRRLETPCNQTDCSLIVNNQAGLADAEGNGAAIYNFGGVVEVLQTTVKDHAGRSGQAVFWMQGSAAILDIESSLIHSNGSGELGHVLDMPSRGGASIRFSTFANNRTQASVFNVRNASLSLAKSVLMRAPSASVISSESGLLMFANVLTDSLSQFDQVAEDVDLFANVRAATTAIFQNPAAGNYHLNDQPETLALIRDEPSTQFGIQRLTVDYSGKPRVDPPTRTLDGHLILGDIGPDEFPSPVTDRLFVGGFEPTGVITFRDVLLPIFRNPKCVNCHTAVDDPALVNNRFDHSGLGLATCSGGCHSQNSEPDFDLAGWRAPSDLRLFELTDQQLCNLARDKGYRGEFESLKHMRDDPPIRWAVISGALPNGGSPPASSISDVTSWGDYLERWFADGARCE